MTRGGGISCPSKYLKAEHCKTAAIKYTMFGIHALSLFSGTIIFNQSCSKITKICFHVHVFFLSRYAGLQFMYDGNNLSYAIRMPYSAIGDTKSSTIYRTTSKFEIRGKKDKVYISTLSKITPGDILPSRSVCRPVNISFNFLYNCLQPD